jgi:hypothetical protein
MINVWTKITSEKVKRLHWDSRLFLKKVRRYGLTQINLEPKGWTVEPEAKIKRLIIQE